MVQQNQKTKNKKQRREINKIRCDRGDRKAKIESPTSLLLPFFVVVVRRFVFSRATMSWLAIFISPTPIFQKLVEAFISPLLICCCCACFITLGVFGAFMRHKNVYRDVAPSRNSDGRHVPCVTINFIVILQVNLKKK